MPVNKQFLYQNGSEMVKEGDFKARIEKKKLIKMKGF
jgi:hypothetical protein